MKKILAFCLLVFTTTPLFAQPEMMVKSFRKLENDMTARIDAPKKDLNGEICAIIKVVTTLTDFTWEPDGLGIVSAEPKAGEYWLYVPHGAKRLTIKHPQLVVLRDYNYPFPIESSMVYEMILITGKIDTILTQSIQSQYLVINPEPADAMIYLDDKFVSHRLFQSNLKPGTYTYRVEAPMYHTEAGKFEISDSKIELNIKLKPAFGYLSVTSDPENDAKVIIDEKTHIKTTPLLSEPILSGEHSVQVIKELYAPSTKKVIITDGQTTNVNFKLNPTYAELKINAPAEAEVFVQKQSKGKGPWQGRLNTGVYSLEARMDKHRTAKKDVDLSVGDKQTVDLRPTPIYGSLDIKSNILGVNVTINEKDYGKTPTIIRDLLIGDYNIELSKQGYTNIRKKVTVVEGNATKLHENMVIEEIQKPKPEPKIEPKEIGESKSEVVNSVDYYKYKKRKTIWLVSALAGSAAGTFIYLQSGSAYTQYKTATDNAVALQDKVDLYNTIYPVCYGVAGLCAIEFVLNAVKQKKNKEPKLSFYTHPIPHGAGIGLAYKF